MPVIGITGGVACGKSTASRIVAEAIGASVFDADRKVHELLAGDPEVARSLGEQFGPEVLDARGVPDRERLRSLVFLADSARRALERILHPKVRDAWEAEAANFRVAHRFLLVEIPLLYETGGESLCDRVVVVACGRPTQLDRLNARRGLDRITAGRIVDAQMPLPEKVRRADHVIWNAGGTGSLERQALRFADLLLATYGHAAA